MTLDYFYGQAGELFSFFRIPKALFQEQRFQDLSTDAKTLYGILLDRMSLSVKNEWFDKKGRVFIIFTIEDVKRTFRCADNKATRLLRELEEFGLIERKRRGQGKPCLVYVKNFSAESSKESVKNRDNDDTVLAVVVSLFAMCLLPFFFALLFRDIGKTLAVPMVLFFLMIFLMNGDQALFISRILPMGQLRLIALQQFTPSMVQFVFTDFLWIFILYFGAYLGFRHSDLK